MKSHSDASFLIINSPEPKKAIKNCPEHLKSTAREQTTSNPYIGCAATFTSRILNNKQPHIFEDGNQTRDFIHVKGVAKANLNALEHSNADYKAINIGTGKPTTIKKLAETLTKLYDKPNLQSCTSDTATQTHKEHISY